MFKYARYGQQVNFDWTPGNIKTLEQSVNEGRVNLNTVVQMCQPLLDTDTGVIRNKCVRLTPVTASDREFDHCFICWVGNYGTALSHIRCTDCYIVTDTIADCTCINSALSVETIQIGRAHV